MYGEGEIPREGMYQNASLRIQREGGQKIRLFAYVPNGKRVIKKLTRLLKPSYLTNYLIQIYLQNWKQPRGLPRRKCVLKNFENSQKNTRAEVSF